MNKKECKIIEDLLPNYIDKLTNEETNEFIEEHLEKCDKCNENYKNMIQNIEIDKVDIREIDYLKKVKRNFKIGIFLITLSIFITIICINTFLLKEEKNLFFSSPNQKNSMIITEYENVIDDDTKEIIKKYYIFDNEDKCISTFVEITSNNQEYLENEYLNLKAKKENTEIDEKNKIISIIKNRTNELSYLGLKYEDEKITYSTNINNDVKKDKIKAFNNIKTVIKEY